MWALDKPSLIDVNNDLDIAFPLTRIVEVDNDRNEIKRIYKLYEDNKGRRDDEYKGVKCNSITIYEISKAYPKTRIGKELEHIRSQLFENIDKCPICSISAPTELDHVLPQSEFRLLAINRQNLVPNCHSCNNFKSAKNPDNFVHSYFANFPNNYFFVANIEVISESIVVDFALIKEHFEDIDLYTRAKNQIKEVKLCSRLRKEVNGFIFDTFQFGDSFNDSNFKKYLNKLVPKYTDIYGKNDWRTALLRSMSSNELITADLLNKVVSKYKPISKRV